MEIEEFIKNTLRQIITAVKDIDNENISDYDVNLDRAKGVEFDLAVTAETSTETKGEAGVKIHILQAGGGKDSKNTESSVSRIKFKVFP